MARALYGRRLTWPLVARAWLGERVLRRRRRDPDPLAAVQPAIAPARWREAVTVALEHRARFGELAAIAGSGPLAGRLSEMTEKVDRGVLAVWELVERGAMAEKALAATDPHAAADRLKAARRALVDAPDGPRREALEAQVDALAARHASAQRLWNTVEDLGDRLVLLDARLGALVAQAAELVAGSTFSDGLDAAEDDLDRAVEELTATREALAELDGLS